MTPGWPATLSLGSVGLRPLRRRDSRDWTRLRTANKQWLEPWDATLPPEAGPPAASTAAVIAALRRRARRGLAMPFVVTWDGEVVGMLTVSNITWGSARWATVGYWVAQSHAGRGITPTALALVCDHLFSAVGLHRVEVSIRPENAASLRVVDKLGFEPIGLAPRYLHIDGRWRDHRIFQLLAEDVSPGRVVDRLQDPQRDR